MRRGARAVGAVALLWACAGCRTSPVATHLGAVDGQPTVAVEITSEERTVSLSLADGSAVALGAQLTHPKGGRGPGIVIVPGASDVSRHGVRSGDGVVAYDKPVPVARLWREALAARGAWVLSYDKRTCGPNDDALCTKNPQQDVDAEGPVALARDVDAACALLRSEPGVDGRIVLMVHGQAAQVALSSQCAASAAAVVLLAPIPRGVDEVIVAVLKERTVAAEKAAKAETDPARKLERVNEAAQLRNLAGTREAEFASMKAGRFAPTARIAGATLAFWKGWIALTGETTALADRASARRVVVLGTEDRQYASADRKRIAALATAGFLEVKGADHHLLTQGRLAPATVDAVGAAIDAALAEGVPGA